MKHTGSVNQESSQESDFPFHIAGLQIRKSRNSLQNSGKQHGCHVIMRYHGIFCCDAARFEDQKKVVACSMEQHFDCQENARVGVLKFKDIDPAAPDDSFSVSLSVHFYTFCTLCKVLGTTLHSGSATGRP